MVDFFLLFIIVIIVCIFFSWKSFNAMRISRQTIIAFTGTLGSGKTYLAVRESLRAYRKQYVKNRIYNFLKLGKIPFIKKVFDDWKHEATFYSNIPVVLRKKTSKEIYEEKKQVIKSGLYKTEIDLQKALDNISPYLFSRPLKKEHLLKRGLLPEKCVVLIDEIGQFASQWEFDNPLVMEQLGSFLRFFRHWLDGRMYVTDQTADGIVKQLRSRIGMIYHLHDFHRYLGITPFYYVTVIPLLLIEEADNVIETESELDDNYFFGFLPYKFFSRSQKYASRCYKPLYTSNAVRDIEKYDSLYTRYLIDISVSQLIRKEYRNDKQRFKDYLYNDPTFQNEDNSNEVF